MANGAGDPARLRARSFGRWGDLLLATAVVIVVPLLSGFPIPLCQGLIQRVDPKSYWLPHALQQIVTLAVVVGLMKTLSRAPLAEWGFNLRQWPAAVRAFGVFAVVWPIPAWLLLSAAEKPASPISAAEIAAVLCFHFVLGGFTQEVLFRGFVIGMLERHWGRPLGRPAWSISPRESCPRSSSRSPT